MNLLRALIDSPGATAVGWALVHSLWQGALVALALGAALRVAQSAQARYTASCAALVVLVAGFAFTLAREMPAPPAHPAALAKPGKVPHLPGGNVGEADAPAPPDGIGYLPWLAPLWIVGVLGFQLRGVAAWMGARRLRGTGVCAAPGMWRTRLDQLAQRVRISRQVMLLESCLADVPVVIGYLRPAILVPVGLLAGLPASQVEAILLHELAHIRRHDYLVNLLQMFVEGLLFYHPAVWWISAVIRAERENCCDDVVVATQGDAYAYASALAALEERRAVAGDAVLASTGGSLVKRIRRLLAQPEGPRAGLTPVFSAVILTVTLVGGMAAWQAAPQTKPAASAAPQAVTAAAVAPAVTAPAAPVQIAQVQPPRAMPAQEPASEPQSDSGPITRYRKWLNQDVAYLIADQERSAYRKWLNEDVAYIITDRERAAFKSIQTDSEREKFIEQFWLQRDPTPNTPENEFKEEIYRRIAYANEHFASRIPGWKTDRGRIYITYGPPDEIDSHPSGGKYEKPASEGGGTTSTFPFEQWRYRYIEDVGNNVVIEFVDTTLSGEYRMTSDPAEKDTLRYIPGAAMPASAGATVQVVGNNGVRISVPVDRYGDHQVNVYARINTIDRSLVKAFENTLSGQVAFTQFLALAPGTYRLNVAVKDLTTGAIAADEIAFEVK
jgi:GWxTD domain-containing protein